MVFEEGFSRLSDDNRHFLPARTQLKLGAVGTAPDEGGSAEASEAMVGVVTERPSRMGMVRLCAAALLPGGDRPGRGEGGPGVRH
ncbi:hypothetical protein, partial [Streptomyces toxytricini]|uniref:hypothetical protein n=1 Tax=Streptomyces toxytricini TaxID=67369 RepID=UPI0034460C4A